MKRSLNFRRLSLGVLANAYDKLVIAGIQLLLVPVLALHWASKFTVRGSYYRPFRASFRPATLALPQPRGRV